MTDQFPDDPRECCEAALKICIDDEACSAETRLISTLELVYQLALSKAFSDRPKLGKALNWMLHECQEAYDVVRHRNEQVHALVRHGTGKHREFDRNQAEAPGA